MRIIFFTVLTFLCLSCGHHEKKEFIYETGDTSVPTTGNPSKPGSDKPDPVDPQNKTQDFTFDYKGQILKARIEVEDSYRGVAAFLSLLSYPDIIDVSLDLETLSANFYFIYDTDEKKLSCRRMQERSLSFEAGYFLADWLSKDTELGKALVVAGQQTQLFDNSEIQDTHIVKPAISVDYVDTVQSYYGNFFQHNNVTLDYDILMAGGQTRLLNGQVCDLLMGQYLGMTPENTTKVSKMNVKASFLR